jgi:hypothetical protein
MAIDCKTYDCPQPGRKARIENVDSDMRLCALRMGQSKKDYPRQKNLENLQGPCDRPVQKVPAKNIGEPEEHHYKQHTHTDMHEYVAHEHNHFL